MSSRILLLLVMIVVAFSNGLLVTGRAKKSLSSTIAVLKFEIVGSDKLPSKSIAKAEAAVEKLKKALKGVVEKEGISVNPPQIELDTTNEGKTAFYETIIEVELATAKGVGEVIEAADKFGTLIDLSYRAEEVRSWRLRARGSRFGASWSSRPSGTPRRRPRGTRRPSAWSWRAWSSSRCTTVWRITRTPRRWWCRCSCSTTSTTLSRETSSMTGRESEWLRSLEERALQQMTRRSLRRLTTTRTMTTKEQRRRKMTKSKIATGKSNRKEKLNQKIRILKKSYSEN